MVSAVRTLAAGTVLSLAAVAAIASQDPGPAAFPRLSARHPLASYRALADAPFGNGAGVVRPSRVHLRGVHLRRWLAAGAPS